MTKDGVALETMLEQGVTALQGGCTHLRALAAGGLSADPEQILKEHLDFLLAADAVALPAIYRDFLAWRHGLFATRGVETHHLWAETAALRQSLLAADDGKGPQRLLSLLAEAAAGPEALPYSVFDATLGAPSDACVAYLEHALRGDRQAALGFVQSLVAEGLSLQKVYGLLEAAQCEVGRLWQENVIGVGEEHLASATTQYVISQLYPLVFGEAAAPRRGHRFVGASVTREPHELGMRMVCDFLELDGWETLYVGPVASAADLLPTLHEQRPRVLGLSTMMVTHLPWLRSIIAGVRAVPEFAGLPVMVGGYPFQYYPQAATRIGADGTALHAEDAVDTARRFGAMDAAPSP